MEGYKNKKSRFCRDFPEFLCYLFQQHTTLKSRLGLKKVVVKIKEGVVDFHFLLFVV